MWKSTVLVLAIALAGCHDPGRDTYRTAQGQYDALMKAGTPAQSRDFDLVLKTLASIPQSSRARGDADALAKEISDARARVPPPPPVRSPQEELIATRAECQRLKSELEGKELAARTRKQELLDACERRLAELDWDAGTQ
jgi:hypothetical protein